jgi:general secretion pathway protein B
MSYILDALKRAEQERQIGQIPNAAAQTAPDPYESDSRRWPWLVLLVLMLAMAVAAFSFWLSAQLPSSKSSAIAVKVERPAAVPVTAVEPVAGSSLPTRVTAVKTEPTVIVQAAPVTVTEVSEVVLADESSESRVAPLNEPVNAPISEPTNEVATEEVAAPEAVVAPQAPMALPTGESAAVAASDSPVEPASVDTDTEVDVASAAVDTNDAAEPELHSLPWLREKSLAFRRDLPSLDIQFHRYSDEPSRRFVMIAGVRYREGERLKSGPKLEHIVEEGLVLLWRGERFIYPLGG